MIGSVRFRNWLRHRPAVPAVLLLVTLVAVPWTTAPPVQAEDLEASKRQLLRPLATIDAASGDPVELCAVEVLDGQRRRLTYNKRFPGPTVHVDPGAKLQIRVLNHLENLTEDDLLNFSPAVLREDESPELRAFLVAQSGVTNLHTHGLHVSPAGRSDNVLLKIGRLKENTYTYELPRDHAPGTHWYHAHLHGSTALQVQGGMAGALIVDAPAGQSLNPPGFQVNETVLVLQFGDGGAIGPNAGDASAEGTSSDAAAGLSATGHELIDAESEADLRNLVNRLDESSLQDLIDSLQGLRVKIPPILANGLENPVARLQQGVEVQRLRIINAGSRRSDYKRLWIEGHPMYLAAIDGVNLTSLPKNAGGEYVAYTESHPLELAPGNRADVYFLPTEGGEFALMMEGEVGVEPTTGAVAEGFSTGGGAVRQQFVRRLLTFDVSGPDLSTPIAEAAGVSMELEAFLPALDQNLKRLQSTPPYSTGYLRPFDGKPRIERRMTFDIRPGGGERTPPPRGQRLRTFYINGRDYNEMVNGHMRGHEDYLGKEKDDGGLSPNGESPWPLRAGTEEEWTIVNESGVRHPFHIHVSPFWVVDIKEANDQGEIVSVSRDDPRLNRWQDTIDLPPNGGSVTVRHRISDFVGVFVVHCHILQHEDRGMMINILTVPKNYLKPERYFEEQMKENCRLNREINGPTHKCVGHQP